MISSTKVQIQLPRFFLKTLPNATYAYLSALDSAAWKPGNPVRYWNTAEGSKRTCQSARLLIVTTMPGTVPLSPLTAKTTTWGSTTAHLAGRSITDSLPSGLPAATCHQLNRG